MPKVKIIVLPGDADQGGSVLLWQLYMESSRRLAEPSDGVELLYGNTWCSSGELCALGFEGLWLGSGCRIFCLVPSPILVVTVMVSKDERLRASAKA